MHFLFFAGLGIPFVIGFFYPGLGRLDGLVGLKPLPFKPFLLIAGIFLAQPGLYFMGISNKSLRALGRQRPGLHRWAANGTDTCLSQLYKGLGNLFF